MGASCVHGLHEPYVGLAMPNGRVKWFNKAKGFGFITQDSGEEVFVHHSAIKGTDRVLEKGQKVQFDVLPGDRGPQAANVTRLRMLF